MLRVDCRWCAQGRPDEFDLGVRVFAGAVTDAYLEPVVRGHVVVVWRGRHVVEPVDLAGDEAVLYHREVLTVARALRDHFKPAVLDYVTRGDAGPHLHTRVSARSPEDDGPDLDEEQWRADAEAVGRLLAF